MDGSVFGDGAPLGSSGRCILQRFVCGGSRVVRRVAGETPVRTEPLPTSLSDALCLGAVLLNFAPFSPGFTLGFWFKA
jgi:hypothetical protein